MPAAHTIAQSALQRRGTCVLCILGDRACSLLCARAVHNKLCIICHCIPSLGSTHSLVQTTSRPHVLHGLILHHSLGLRPS